MTKEDVQLEVAQTISVLWNDDALGLTKFYLSPDGEMSFQFRGRQVIIKVVAAR